MPARVLWSALFAWALPSLLAPAPAFALATEHFGNAPIRGGWGFSPALLPLLNDHRRTYWYEVNGDASFYYRGDTAAANEMMRRFAAVEKGREVVLHAGPLVRTNLGGKVRIDADWYLHVPGGITLSNHPDGGLVTDKGPALHLYIARPRTAPSATPAQIARWLQELNSDEFETRQRASGELEKQGLAIEVALRQALAKKPALEARLRIERLLAKMTGINLDLLVVPEGLTVVGPEEMLARCRKGLQSKDAVIRGVAAGQIAGWEPDRKVAVAGLVRVLKEDRHEYVQRCVAGALSRRGKEAEPALPLLREGLLDRDVNIRNAFRHAIDTIEKAKAGPALAERAKQERMIQADIRRFLKLRADRAKK